MTDEKQKKPMTITSITLGIGRRCPTCGELPYEFRGAFARRVEKLYLIPRKGKHYSAHPDGTPYEYHIMKGDQSPDGLYPGVIVPDYLVGKVIMIKVQDDNDKQIEIEERKRRSHPLRDESS